MTVQTPRKNPGFRLHKDTLRFVLLCIQALIFLAPLYWMVTTAFKTDGDAIAQPVQWFPTNPTLENFDIILNTPDANILRWAWNSLFTSVAYTIAHLFISCLTAYPFARMRFKGREQWFWFLLASMMIPNIVTLIPLYIMMIDFNWIDSYHVLIWPGVANVFGVFMMRQFFSNIPVELEEAARLDGANSLVIFFRIMLPLSVPALVTLGVFSFLGAWNNYLWPQFMVHGDMLTLPVGIGNFTMRYGIEYGKLMAGATLTAIPVLLVYVFAQKYIEQGMTLTGLKE